VVTFFAGVKTEHDLAQTEDIIAALIGTFVNRK
jgi:hypothetical protein